MAEFEIPGRVALVFIGACTAAIASLERQLEERQRGDPSPVQVPGFDLPYEFRSEAVSREVIEELRVVRQHLLDRSIVDDVLEGWWPR